MRKNQRPFRLTTTAFVALAFLFLLSLGLFVLLAHEVVAEQEDWFDTRTFHFLQAALHPGLIPVFKTITFFGSSNFLFPAWLILFGVLYFTRQRGVALDIAVLGISSTLLMFGLKAVFARKRPEMPLFDELTNYSFPSGHALSSLIFCFGLVWLVWREDIRTRWKWLFTVLLLLFSLLIGISRIVLRYHYASDVIGGFSLGIAFLLLFFGIRMKWRKQP